MRKRLKIVSLLTALALLGGLLGGCGKSSRIETDSVAVQETTDPLLAEHQKQLEQLNSSYTKRLTSNSQGVEFHLYYDDTQSMLGFVEAANGQNTFVTMLDKSIACDICAPFQSESQNSGLTKQRASDIIISVHTLRQ